MHVAAALWQCASGGCDAWRRTGYEYPPRYCGRNELPLDGLPRRVGLLFFCGAAPLRPKPRRSCSERLNEPPRFTSGGAGSVRCCFDSACRRAYQSSSRISRCMSSMREGRGCCLFVGFARCGACCRPRDEPKGPLAASCSLNGDASPVGRVGFTRRRVQSSPQ